MRQLRWSFTLPALWIATAGFATAAEIRDKANLFSAEAVKKAESDLDRLEKDHAVPVTIETIDSLEGARIEDLTTKHAEQANAKGVYVLISKADRKMFIEASKGYRTALTRERLNAIDEAFTRQFKKSDYDAGLSRGVSQIESTVAETHPAAKARRAGQAPVAGKPSSGGMGMLLTIGLGLLALFIVIRILGAIFGGNRGSYAGQQRPMGPGAMGGPGYGPGYGGGGGGGGFMSSMFGGIGGALAGNWLYDQFSGRHHDTSLGQSGYDPAAGAPPADNGPEWGTGGAEGDWGGGDAGAGGGADWGGGGGDVGGGGGDWGGGGGGDWGGGGGDDGGSW